MSWTRLGVVVPAPPPLAWAASHAALPVVHRDGEHRRLFFSTRDDRGRSSIAAAELVPGDRFEVAAYEPEPVLEPGPLGAFDDAGVTSSCVVQAGGRLFQYYTGWSLGVSVPFYFYVGCAVSDDGGKSFRRASPSPVLERNDVDPFLTASPWVLIENGTWRMWYVSSTGWEDRPEGPRHRYHIKYAESPDGLNWQRSGHVAIDYHDADEYAIARPCVVRDADGYRMWFSCRGTAYRIGFAESADGRTWNRDDDAGGLTASGNGWDGEAVEYACVFDGAGRRWMLYNGDGYGETGIGLAALDEST
jgi:hypothetical protein